MMCLLRKKNMTVQGSYSSYMSLKSGTFNPSERSEVDRSEVDRSEVGRNGVESGKPETKYVYHAEWRVATTEK